MWQLIKEMFQDVDGSGSNKRLITFGTFILLCVIAIGCTFFKATFIEAIWQDIFFALLAFMGMITSEKFTKRGISKEG